MTSISDVTSTSSAAAAAAAAATAAPKNTLDKDSFLRLLVAQLQNQDPTQTQDSDKMVQQMTSFASLEQMQNQTAALQSLQNQDLGIFQAQTTSLVGKKVRISQGMTLQNGKSDFVLNLPSDAATTSLSIKDASGQVVRVMEKGAMTAGDHSITWDGKDESGRQLSDGIYTIEAACKDKAGASVKATTSCYATVESVLFTNGSVQIKAAGRTFDMNQISEVSTTSSTSNASPTQFANMIGKRVRIAGNISLENGKSSFTMSLPADAAGSQVSIKDANGKVIRVLSLNSHMAGDSTITWDGLDSNGNPLADGVYSAEITAQDSAGKSIKASLSSFATVNSVLYSDGTVLFRVANRNFGLNDISEITA